MRWKLFLLATISTLSHISNPPIAHAESRQNGKLIAERNLANLTLNRNRIDTTKDIPSATELIAKSKRKSRKPATRQQPASTIPPAKPSSAQTPASTNPEPQVIVADIVITADRGVLEPALAAKIRQVLTIEIGKPTTRSQLEQNLNAVKALGDFATVQIVPEDTAKGVKINFLVKTYGTLSQVQLKTLPATIISILNPAAIEEIFKPQYGKRLNAIEFKTTIDKLNQLYQTQGYNLAQVVDIEELNPDGKLTVVVAEGSIEDVRVRFLNKKGEAVDENKQPYPGQTRPFIIVREAQSKSGTIFNRNTVEKDLRRIYGLGLFDDVRVSFAPGSDPAKVVLQYDVIERGKNFSIVPNAGYSSINGFFASLNYNQLDVGGNAQTLSANAQTGTTGLLGELNFTDPWIATDPHRTSYTVNAFARQSTSFVFSGGKTPLSVPGTTSDTPTILRTGGGITFNRPLDGDPYNNGGWRGSLGVQYQRVSTRDINGGSIVPKDSGGNDLSFSKTGQDDLLMLQLGVTKDARDSFSDPTQGSLLKLGVDQSVPVGLGNITMTKARASFTQYVPMKLINLSPGSQSLLFNVQGGTILGDLPPYEAFSLGGTSGVRGYEDGDVGSGRSYLQATAEYRFPIVSFFGLGIFADYGTDLGTGSSVPGNPAGARSKPGNGFGYGAGVRFQSPIGPLRLDYAINDLKETRIQFGLGERF
ncbi:BamA/TamA family outer membrane protein [Chamaesiphon minutus]|uniref:Outer membrane protein/protective antigen OMA87 n=1 Tax=Chamaesiphon minutus (strain ATCC 27169 / PCC 6605) TaxID=1173020 RepID=K9UP47_CHAP6|nr:BamA/TamA family outer membrane protein [Chamaesiphon minutus]AFY96448.1 outer membrane protein/protective antigen OMA87 [Chamaesiphon minutus PCC 6605]